MLRLTHLAVVAGHVVLGAHIRDGGTGLGDAANAGEAALVGGGLAGTLRREEDGSVVAALPLAGGDGGGGRAVLADLVERGAIVSDGDAEGVDAAETAVGACGSAGGGGDDLSIAAVRTVWELRWTRRNTGKRSGSGELTIDTLLVAPSANVGDENALVGETLQPRERTVGQLRR